MTDSRTKVRSVLLVVLVVVGMAPAASVGSVGATAAGNDAGNNPGSPTVEAFSVTSSNDETVNVSFHGSESITDIEVNVADENDDPVATLTEDDFTASDAGDFDEYRATTTVESNGTYAATLLKAADDDGNDAADGQTGRTYVGPVDGSIDYLNESAVEVTGEFERVWIATEWYGPAGLGGQTYTQDNVSGTTTFTEDAGGINGSAIVDVGAEKHAGDGEVDLSKKNPHDYDVRPESVNVSVENVSETGDGSYEVTFEYVNPNDERMVAHDSRFTSGNVDGEPPRTFYPGENTTTVTWTPLSDDERVTWEVNQTNFDLDDVSANTQPASEQGGVSDVPNAALTVTPQTIETGSSATFDAGNSTDDGSITEYRWDTDGDGVAEQNSSEPKLLYQHADAGEHEVTVTVVDDDDNTDTATATLTVKESGGDDPPNDGGPSADLSLSDQLADFSNTVEFNASGSTDDGAIVKYEWDFDGDGDVDRTTPDEATEGSKINDAHTVYHDVYTLYDDPGTYTATVTVVADDGDTDNATAELEVEQNDHTAPNATLDVPSEVTVDEQFTVEATNFTEVTLAHVGWVFDGEVGPEGETANHTFEETGEKKVELRLIDHAGNKNVLTGCVDVTTAEDGDTGDGDDGDSDNPDDGDSNNPDDGDSNNPDDGDDSSPDDGEESDPDNGDDPDEGGLEDDDDRDSRYGTIPSVDPDDSDDDDSTDERPLDDGPRNVSENLTDDDGRFGSVVVTAADGGDLSIEVHGTAPGGLPAPTPAADGFEAVSFLTVDGADRATLTVSKDRLDAIGAAPDDVSLFRYENGTWTAIETSVANATDDAHRFQANVTNGTYAVGVERPAIGVADVTVQDQQVTPGESATVAVTVENDGLAEGTQTVELSVGGDVVATRNVSLPAGEWRTLRFAPTFASDGVYDVSVGDANVEVVVESAETTTTTETSDSGGETTDATTTETVTDDVTTTDDSATGVPGFGVGVSLVALLAAALLALRRR